MTCIEVGLSTVLYMGYGCINTMPIQLQVPIPIAVQLPEKSKMGQDPYEYGHNTGSYGRYGCNLDKLSSLGSERLLREVGDEAEFPNKCECVKKIESRRSKDVEQGHMKNVENQRSKDVSVLALMLASIPRCWQG